MYLALVKSNFSYFKEYLNRPYSINGIAEFIWFILFVLDRNEVVRIRSRKHKEAKLISKLHKRGTRKIMHLEIIFYSSSLQ